MRYYPRVLTITILSHLALRLSWPQLKYPLVAYIVNLSSRAILARVLR